MQNLFKLIFTMEKQKILEIENQAKLRNISSAKYCREIRINLQSYYQAKTLLKITNKNKIYKVQNEEPVIENKSLSITINDFTIKLEQYFVTQLVEIFRAIKNV